MNSISVLINTYNEEKNLSRCLKSLEWVDEIVVVDMFSKDKTIEIAKKFHAKIYTHKYTGFVEPARNYGISKTTNPWVLIIDADEVVSKQLKLKLIGISNLKGIDYVLIPRKNIIFGKWIKHTGWWPDHKIRFFRRGKVKWYSTIHKDPQCQGINYIIPPQEKYALIHYNYSSINKFIDRANNYTSKHAERLIQEGYKFKGTDLIIKPFHEFTLRYFRSKGFLDGLHGFILSLLMSFYFFITYAKIWEKSNNILKVSAN